MYSPIDPLPSLNHRWKAGATQCTYVIIGGGEIAARETWVIDQFIAGLAPKAAPRHLFIPTASHDADGYIETLREIYGRTLGCRCDALCLLSGQLTVSEVAAKIGSADIIYVGGGDPQLMMAEWRRHGVDKLLRKAAAAGTIMSGLSAGSICWFEKGIGDTDEEVEGLGLLPGCHCPHFDERAMEADFWEFVARREVSFLGIENNCALVIQGNRYCVIRSDERKNAYMVKTSQGRTETSQLSDIGMLAELTTALVG